MKKLILASSAALAVLASAAPASAAVAINFNGVQTDENVLFASSTSTPATTVTAQTNQTKFNVTFTNALGLLADASGQSSIRNPDTAATPAGNLYGTTFVDLEGNVSFATAEFNLPGIQGPPPPPEADRAVVTAFLVGGGSFTTTLPGLALDGNGENRISISGTAGERFLGFSINLTPTGAGVGSLTQVRLGGVSNAAVAAVPEPATWAMLILGFGAIGGSLRRRAFAKGRHSTQMRYA